MTVLMPQTALFVQKVTQKRLHLAFVTVMPLPTLLMMGLFKMRETSIASMRGQLEDLQDPALAQSALLDLKVLTVRLLLSV
jgi:hypothetical protein